MSEAAHIYVQPGSRLRRFAEAVAWLWRLGPVADSPSPERIAFGWHEEAAGLRALLDSGDLLAAVIFANRPGPETDLLPSRARLIGVADFGEGNAVSGQFPVLHGGRPWIRSSLGVHATRSDNWVVMAADPEASWGALDGFWIWPALRSFFDELLPGRVVSLPAVGLLRFDDIPGTAYHQLQGRAKTDEKANRRAEQLVAEMARSDAVLNVAFSSRALAEGEEVPLDRVWPKSVATYARGVAEGRIEAVCHGYLHLASGPLERGEIEPREYAWADREEAERKLAASLEWIETTLGARPRTFIAPTWAYGEGITAALAEREIWAWLPPEPGPLVTELGMRETLFSTLEGLHRLSYGPLRELARAGLPPTVVFHGGLLDQRMAWLREDRHLPTAAGLARRRDVFRIAEMAGIRWIGAAEMVEKLTAHSGVAIS